MRDALQVALLLLATAVVVVVVCRLLRLPALIGYLVVGILIGPHALGWVPDTEDTRYLAEFGVVFLMFSIGLEFSLPKLVTMRRIVFGLGAAEVTAATLLVLAIALVLGLGWQGGVVLGGVFAMSSTAILGKMLADRLELNSPHGRQIIGVRAVPGPGRGAIPDPDPRARRRYRPACREPWRTRSPRPRLCSP